jgi:hypothetical protein
LLAALEAVEDRYAGDVLTDVLQESGRAGANGAGQGKTKETPLPQT